MNAGSIVLSGLDHGTPWPWSTETTAPALVACPFLGMAGRGMTAAGVQELYRIAYERARAAARPTRYSLALSASPN
jgi:hypothetical protein